MKVTMLKDSHNGDLRYSAGDVVELSEELGGHWCLQGLCVPGEIPPNVAPESPKVVAAKKVSPPKVIQDEVDE